ncbi:MAG: hypothetical protein WDZ69_01475 [Candidatus Pacearchaeota archaeon]
MKSLKPSAREKKRYLLVRGKANEIEKAILEGIGVLGISKVGLNWIKSGKDSTIISTNRESVDSVRACFAIWPGNLEVRKVSGTLKGLRG